MHALRLLAWLTLLAGLVLAVTPWLLGFTGDHIARIDVLVGGLVVGLLGAALSWLALSTGPAARLTHPS
jgi:hypothetical protein